MDKYNRRLLYFLKMGFFAHHNGRTEFLYFFEGKFPLLQWGEHE
jgi:hypothetical protein